MVVHRPGLGIGLVQHEHARVPQENTASWSGVNDEHLTFARSQYNALLNAGFRLDQVAVVVTIDRQTNDVKKIFLQAHGETTSIQRGSCQRIDV